MVSLMLGHQEVLELKTVDQRTRVFWFCNCPFGALIFNGFSSVRCKMEAGFVSACVFVSYNLAEMVGQVIVEVIC